MKKILIYLLNRMDFNNALSVIDGTKHARDINSEMVGRFLDNN